jgi:hypothetical protein
MLLMPHSVAWNTSLRRSSARARDSSSMLAHSANVNNCGGGGGWWVNCARVRGEHCPCLFYVPFKRAAVADGAFRRAEEANAKCCRWGTRTWL